MPTKEGKIIEPHQPLIGQPLIASRSAMMTFERKPTEWQGWIWCTDDDGISAWVPEAWVDIDGARCRMKRDYNSRELAVEKGEKVSVEMEESGWAWVRKGSGECGWIPMTCLEGD